MTGHHSGKFVVPFAMSQSGRAAMVTTLGREGPSFRPRGHLLPVSGQTGQLRKSSGWVDTDGEDVLRRVDVGVEHRPTVGADKARAADAAGRIDGVAAAARLRRVRRIDRDE